MRTALVAVSIACLGAGGCGTSATPGTMRAPVAASAPAGAPSGATGYSVNGDMTAVAATSATDAWAVGDLFAGGKPLIVHWDGTRWSSVPAGAPSYTGMQAVAASSPGNAWVVGETSRPGSTWEAPVILHWTGRAWRKVPLSAPPGTFLSSVSVTSLTNAWAVGLYWTSDQHFANSTRLIALHWDGSAWRRVPLPGLPLPAGGGATLSGVSATSASNAWAVGTFLSAVGDPEAGFVLHWDGSSWSQVPSAPARAAAPSAVAATAADYAWLLGAPAGLWNGHDWTTVPVPLVTTHEGKRGGSVTALAASGHAAWVAGSYCTTPAACENGMILPLLLRWTGNAWKPAPLPTSNLSITGLAVTSPANAWAVGDAQPRTTVILHWNGSKWT